VGDVTALGCGLESLLDGLTRDSKPASDFSVSAEAECVESVLTFSENLF
jgi:hypothetical protein